MHIHGDDAAQSARDSAEGELCQNQPGEVGDGKENIPSNNKNGFSRPTPMSSIGSCPK